MKNKIYIFSGLGADERVFQKINFCANNFTFINWIPPIKNETIEAYAIRLTNQITCQKPSLIGYSFGGMMAIEVAKHIEVEKVVIIASVKTASELPFYFRLIGKIGLHHLLPYFFIRHATFITYWFFDASSLFEKQLLKQILLDADAGFVRWAIARAVKWSHKERMDQLTHIHGTKDKILPLAFVDADVKINGGGHLMILNKAEEITIALNKLLSIDLKIIS